MFKTFSPETERFRFFGPIKEASHEMLVGYTQIDYDREIAIVALLNEGGLEKMVGVVRLIADPYNDTAEYAIVVGDPWAGQGLGTLLTRYILEIAGSADQESHRLRSRRQRRHAAPVRKLQLHTLEGRGYVPGGAGVG
jgi:acetyltransferase